MSYCSLSINRSTLLITGTYKQRYRISHSTFQTPLVLLAAQLCHYYFLECVSESGQFHSPSFMICQFYKYGMTCLTWYTARCISIAVIDRLTHWEYNPSVSVLVCHTFRCWPAQSHTYVVWNTLFNSTHFRILFV